MTGRPIIPAAFQRVLLAVALAGTWSTGLAAPPADDKDSKAGPADPPVKVESPEQAGQMLDGLIREIGLAEGSKLDFEPAKAVFEKLEAIKPFADKLGESHRNLLHAGLGAVGLAAGEPAAALDGCRFMMNIEKGDAWAVRGYMAAQFLGDEKAARELLPKINEKLARALAQESDLIGRKLPAVKLDLLDGRTLRLSGDDKVVVFDLWAVVAGDAYTRTLPAIKELHEKYRKYDSFGLVGVNLNFADERSKVVQFVRQNGVAWPQYFEGRGPDNQLAKDVLGVGAAICLVVVGPDRRVYHKAGPQDTFLPYAIHAALRQVEKKRAKPPTDRPTVVKPPASQPDRPVIPPKSVADTAEERAAQMLKLSDSYRAAGMGEKADELLRELVKQYPTSRAAAKARELLGPSP